MNKLNSLKDLSCQKNDSNEETKNDNEGTNNLEKILCNHCGRTSSNGIRCLGICVADNEY